MKAAKKIYRAKFEYWILPLNHKATALAEEPRGPFEIEVFEDEQRVRTKTVWVAEMLPTRQRLPGHWKSSEEARSTVTIQFRRQVEPWQESEFHKPSNQEVLW